MESGPVPREPPSWDELYKIDLMPTEIFFKFRKHVQGISVGLNLEVCHFPISLLSKHTWIFLY